MNDKELKELIERLKRYARSKGARHDEVDDFSQDAAFKLYGGRKASFGQLYVDFLRKTYGDTRTSSGSERSRQTIQYAEYDQERPGGDARNGLSTGTDPGCIEKALETLKLDEHVALSNNKLTDDIFTPSLKSQLLSSAKSKIQAYLELQHGYHLMETETLWISYIEI